jgi:predicted permease
VQQLVVESLVYCATGTAGGLIMAALLGGSVMSLVPLPLRTQLGLGSVSFDWRVALFASAVTAVTAVIAGLVPARRLANTNPIESLRQHARGSTGPRTLMQSLVIGEVALASVLLMASALMADNLSRLNTADLGLQVSELSSIEITLPESRYAAAPDRIAAVRAVTDAARSVAGVRQAAIVTVNPLDRGSFGAAIETEDQLLAPREPGHIVNNRLVTDGWFETAGVRLRQGRVFTAQDDERAPLVAIVSHRMADRFWPGDEAVGKRVRLARPGMPWLTVVGIVDDVRDFGDWRETWYLPYAQHASTLAASNLHLMLRSPLPPDVLGRAMQSALQSVDARLPVPIPIPMTDMWTSGLEQQRLAAAASALFGASGLLLAIIGTYGVLAYTVSARAREFGIRLALGAERRVVLFDVMRRGAMLAAVGLTAGVGAGVLVNRALADVATETAGVPLHVVVAVVSVLGASAIVASLVPALRATRIDPADVMRIES